MKNNLIVVTGVLGSGKTTIANILAKHLNYEFIEECWEENPYLEDFYKGKNQLLTEKWFIKKDYERYQKAIEMVNLGSSVVLDKPLYLNHVYIEMSPISLEDRAICHSMIQKYIDENKKPDLVLCINASPATILNRVLKRSRDMESVLDIDWFKKCVGVFNEQKKNFNNLPCINLDTNKFDFSKDFKLSIENLEKELNKSLNLKFEKIYSPNIF